MPKLGRPDAQIRVSPDTCDRYRDMSHVTVTCHGNGPNMVGLRYRHVVTPRCGAPCIFPLSNPRSLPIPYFFKL